MSAMNNESEIVRESRVKSRRVLTFLAESVNLYNWYLRRSDTPYNKLYDESEAVTRNLYEELYKRAKEDPEVSIKLKEAISVWNLDAIEGEYDADVLEEEFERAYQSDVDKKNSDFWSYFVQRRQHDIVQSPFQVNSECEQMLWEEVDGTTDAPELYARLILLESNYIELISQVQLDGTMSHSAGLTSVADVELISSVPPLFGVAELELERVYLIDYFHEDRGGGNYSEYDYYEHNAGYAPDLEVVDKQMVCDFECPLCYEVQETGSEGVRTMCDHDYCGPCFWSMVSVKPECGMCRGAVREYVELTVV